MLWLLQLAAAAAAGVARPRHRAARRGAWPRRRREVALRNLELCLPELAPAQRDATRARTLPLARPQPARARPALVRAPRAAEAADPRRRRRRTGRAQRAAGDVAGAALHRARHRRRVRCSCSRRARCISVYQPQSNPVFDAAIRRGRLRFGNAEIVLARRGGRALMRAMREGYGFFNLPDMDFGERDAAFVPFFGVPAATLLAPSRLARALDMVVQPVVAEMLPRRPGLPRALLDAVARLSERRCGRRHGAHEPLDRAARSGASRRSTCGCTSASRRGRRASRRSTERAAAVHSGSR